MKDLTVGNEGKLIFQFAVPMLLGNIFQQLYNVIDSIIIGNYLGKEALAAVGASFPILFTLISLVIGIASGSTILIAQFYGASDIVKVKKTIDTLYISMFFASITMSVLGIYFCEDIFRLIDLPEDVLPQATTYLQIYLGGLIMFFGFNGTSAILRGLGDSKTPLVFLMISTFINIGLDLLFIVVFEWGIEGVAIATIIAQGIAFFAAIIYLNRTHEVVKLALNKLVFTRDIFNKSMRIGLPTGLQQSFVALGMLTIIWIVNPFGTNTLAAYSIGMRVDSLAAMAAMNFAAALATFVGQNMGANKLHRVKSGLIVTFLMTTAIAVTLTSGVLIFSRQLIGLFTTDQEVIEIGREFLFITSPFYIMFSSMFVVNGVMRGAGATLIPMFITLIALWVVRIPASYLLSQKMGVIGIWWGLPMAWVTGLILSYIYYISGKWKSKVVVNYAPAEKG
jgi:putative MATE family efflux protein